MHLATEVISKKLAKKVLFIPAGVPWQKSSTLVANAMERAAMVATAIAGHESFQLSTREIERSGPTFTVETVREFQSEQPTEDFILLLGSDAFNGVPTWKESEELLRSIDIVVAKRPGKEITTIPNAHVTIIESEMFAISSTEVRQAVRTGADLNHLVPPEIHEAVKRIYGA
jgi:nicotinate-nucleotide adenylyltransferase